MTTTQQPARPGTVHNRGPVFDVPVPLRVSAYQLAAIIITAIESGCSRQWTPKQRIRNLGAGVDAFDPRTDHAPTDGPEYDRLIVDARALEGEVWDEFIARNVALGGSLTFYEDVDESGDDATLVAHCLTREKLLAGIGKALIAGAIVTLEDEAEPDGVDVDADGPGADVILQYALLGEVRYA